MTQDEHMQKVYKAEDGKLLREQRRDVSKYVKKYNTIISIIGMENQTLPDKDMVFRVMGYDYTSYRAQMDAGKQRYPVITRVLYFGNEPWNEACSIREAIDAPEVFKKETADYKIQVIDVPRLSEEVRGMLTSDFAVVADYFANRYKPDYKPSGQVIKHVNAVLRLLEVFADAKYKSIEDEIMEMVQKGEDVTMCEYVQRVLKEGRIEGERYKSESITIKLLKKKTMSYEEIAEIVDEPVEYVKELEKEMLAREGK